MSSSAPLSIASLVILFVVAGTLIGRLPVAVITTYGVVSAVTFLVYWFGKSAAQHGRWRTKESSLLFLGLACGWPGAVVAQRALRHKSRKDGFQMAFCATAGMNSLALACLFTDSGLRFLDQLLN
jgi:uncharacterized membrane protein YsdA (DUF1294 family)